MPARLDVYLSDQPIRRFSLDEGREYVLGRDPACDLTVDDPRISRRHARLWPTGGGWRVADLGSKNGTWIDGRPAADAGELPAAVWLSLGGMPARLERVTEEARRADAARDHLRWQTSLDLARRIAPEAGLQALLAEILTSVREVSGCERSFVLLTRTDGDLELAASVGLEGGEISSPGFAGSRSAIERALATGRPVTAVDARFDSLLAGAPSVIQGGIAGLVCVPLQVLGRLIGVIYADSRRPGAGCTELDVEILTALASHAALAIGMARLAREVDAVRAAVPVGETAAGGRPATLEPRPAPREAALVAAWERAVPAYRPAAGVTSGAFDSTGRRERSNGSAGRLTWTGLGAAGGGRRRHAVGQ